MTEQEKQEIINDLESRFEEKYKGIIAKEDVATVLKEPRNKWFRDEYNCGHNSPMSQAFGSSIVAWQVWEEVRKLTCRICGKSYVRQLNDNDHADEVAEKLCQLIYDLTMERSGLNGKIKETTTDTANGKDGDE